MDPLAHAAIVALLCARLGTLRTEAARPQQSSDVIRMVNDLELMADDVDDPPARPQARGVAGRLRSRHDQARQSTALGRAELRRSPGGWPGAQAGAALASVRPLPSADGAPIDTQALGHDMNGDITLEQLDRAYPSSLELSRAPLWAHGHLPQKIIGHYLCRSH